jgi:hypothetical protein
MAKLYEVSNSNEIIQKKLPYYKYTVFNKETREILGLFPKRINAEEFRKLKESK